MSRLLNAPGGRVLGRGRMTLFNSSLPAEVARARNAEVLGEVVDDFLERVAEARKARERSDAERKEREERSRRIEEYERQERESAALLSERTRVLAEQIAEREVEAERGNSDARRQRSVDAD